MKRGKKNATPARLSELLAKECDIHELRWRRDLAKRDGDFKLAFACAVAIDKKKGLY